ncbi:APC family permease [Pasteurella atlantica]|uniref:APC family permease n=1 Tax=Pasteurellaceae TaxID=712 RepID=UPI0027613892|nr:APC family permease [Pasteurella atlantica]MDP8098666.1 APC family permease [Pasteurella atlantica]MDP8106778.1 APC family permease [Pasteurella atlantica]MDP8116468.1 APC family permease [Pasteurella atlantica]
MQKKLSKLDLLALVIGSIVGWGAFTLPQNQFLPHSGIINTTIGLLIGAFVMLFIEKGYSIMIKNSKKEDGGEFSYTYQNLGKLHGFIVGWSLSLCYLSLVPLNATAFVLVFKVIFPDLSWLYLYSVAGYNIYFSDILLAWFIILTFGYINIKGIHISSLIQKILIILLIINIFIILFTMIDKIDVNIFYNNYINNESINFSQILTVLSIVPFLFVGFDVIVQVSTDLGFTRNKTSLIAIVGIIFGAIIYSILNLITALAFDLDLDTIITKQWALGEGVLKYIGTWGFSLLIIALLAAVTGGINGFMLSSSKLLGAIANYKLIPSQYAHKNGNNVYYNAILFIMIISMIAPFFGRKVIIYIVDLCSLLVSITYAYVTFISISKCDNKTDKMLVIIGFIIALCFILLLIIPFSPVFLSIPSFVFMLCWSMLGTIYYIIHCKL